MSNFSVKKPYTVVVAILLIAILGYVSLINMSSDLFPSINLPYAVVSTTYIGASPEEVELAVTRPTEQRMASISNIKNVRSVSREHMSIVILEFAETTNMDSAIIEIRESLDMIKNFMPSGVGSPMILKLNPNMLPIMVMAVTVEGQEISQSSDFIQRVIVPEFESIEGIASVSASGLIEEQVHVLIREEKLTSVTDRISTFFAGMGQMGVDVSGISLPQISSELISGILKGQNFTMPAGYIIEGNMDYLVRVGDKIRTIDELQEIVVMDLPFPNFEPIRISDVADVLILDNSSEMYSKVNGNDSVSFTIQKQTEYATADLAARLRDKAESIANEYPGVEITLLMDQGEYIDLVVSSTSMNLIFGGLLAILVLFLFLRDIRPTLVVGLAIPISVVTAFVLMYFSNISLNIISMGGLALGVGMLVDNSIVVIENIYRMRNEGKSPLEAAVEGAIQVSGAILASTLTTIAVFMPIVFTQGIARQIFTDMGLTIAYSLLASLVIALTLVPMMASRMLKRNIKDESRVLKVIKMGYSKALTFSLRNRALVSILVLVLFVLSIFGSLRMGTELFPASDMGTLSANLNMPLGSTFEDTKIAADELYDLISKLPEIETIGARIGGGIMGGMLGGARGGSGVSFNIILKEERESSTSEVAQKLRDIALEAGYDLNVEDGAMNMASFGESGISIVIRGREFDEIERIAQEVSKIVASVEGTVDISDGLEQTTPEYRVIVDKDNSIAVGLSVAQVFMAVNEALAESKTATSITYNGIDIDVYVDDESRGEISLSDIKEMLLRSPRGEMIPLTSIAEIVEARGFSTINRNNQQRYITVTSAIAEGYNVGIVSREVSDKLKEYNVPVGYEVEIGGEIRMINESFSDLFLMLAVGITFIYLIMVAQFQSLMSPFIVMFTIPLAFTGGFMALIVTGNPIGLVSLMGLIILSGIVVNNGIVFVDYVNKLREMGMDKRDAIMKAGQDRLRPIMMTALTTIFALSTMSMGAGEGTEMMQPMAITAIGGLIYSTVLTLIFIPVLYDLFNKKEYAKTK